MARCRTLLGRVGARRPAPALALAVALAVAGCLCLAAQAPAAVYWTNEAGGTIGRANLDGTNIDQSFITGANGSSGVAVDGAYLYWTTDLDGTVGRADLGGTNANPSFIPNANAPFAVAVDVTHVYWIHAGSLGVARADLDGTNANPSFIPGLNARFGVAVDVTHVYWTNFGGGTIGRANLDGTSADQSFITGAGGPSGIAVDGTYVYWVNNTGNTIGRADLDGTNIDQSFITGANYPTGMAVDATHVYWTNVNLSAIGRANLDGTGVDQSFITGASVPYGVAVDALAVPTLTTTASAGVAVGGQVHDTATLAGGHNPGGSISFRLYGPDDGACAGAAAFWSGPVAVAGNGVYDSSDFTPTAPGTYRWIADYSGDVDNAPAWGACNAANESVTVSALAPPLPAGVFAPVVTGISPIAGPAGTEVAISGASFAGATHVLFGASPASFVIDGFQRIAAVAPAGVDGTVEVRVVTPAGTSLATPAGHFAYTTQPGQAQPAPGAARPRRLLCARVPSLVGRTLSAAKKALRRHDCATAGLKVKRRPRYREGSATVRAQTPKPGTPVYQGELITITIR
jgi:virginiamycin B lyase